MKEILNEITGRYELGPLTNAAEIGGGLINKSWTVEAAGRRLVLQQLNTNVFSSPAALEHNLQVIGKHIGYEESEYAIPLPLAGKNGCMLQQTPEGYFRLLPYIESQTFHTVATSAMAFQAARAFGSFACRLRDVAPVMLRDTIPDFHNLELRYHQFIEASHNGLRERRQLAHGAIKMATSFSGIYEQWKKQVVQKQWPLRVMHHDTKISNVLFGRDGNARAVIDLDTVMAGYVISDTGDMMRTYLSPAGEEEADLRLVHVRKEYYHAIVDGYLEGTGNLLTPEERRAIYFSGCVMIYMQALRFLTDFLLGDPYYGAKYEQHNLVRAGNQLHLLEDYALLQKDLVK